MSNRVFVYDQREFPDPDPKLSVDEVRQHMATYFPELSNAETKQSKRGEDDIVEFKRRVGTKGGEMSLLEIQTHLLKPNTNISLKMAYTGNYVAFYPIQEHHLANNTKLLEVVRASDSFDLRNYDTIYEHEVSIALFPEPYLPEVLHYIKAWQILAFHIQPPPKGHRSGDGI